MSASPPPASLGPFQKGLLLAVAFALALALLVLRGGLQSESPLEQLARRSLDPDVALTNGQPTLIEFYADWCQACREMAPAMSLEQSTQDRLDVVVNVDNPRWLDLVDRYEVNGIPRLNLFGGRSTSRSFHRCSDTAGAQGAWGRPDQRQPSPSASGDPERKHPAGSGPHRQNRTSQPWLTGMARPSPS